jgi:hypothetical protein
MLNTGSTGVATNGSAWEELRCLASASSIRLSARCVRVVDGRLRGLRVGCGGADLPGCFFDNAHCLS